jgi:hypothetical protein
VTASPVFWAWVVVRAAAVRQREAMSFFMAIIVAPGKP